MPTCREKHPLTHEDLSILYGRKAGRLDLYRANLKPESLSLLAEELNAYPNLTELILDFCDFRRGFAKAMQEFVPKLKHVTVLSFRCAKFDKTAMDALISGVKEHARIVSLDMYSTGLTADPLARLGAALSSSSAIVSLNLSSNKFDAECAKALSSQLLKNTSSLQELQLENSSLDELSTPALFEGLIANKSVRTLVLSNNLFQESDAAQMKAYLSSTKVLESLSMGSIFANNDSWKSIGEGLAANSSLQTVSLESNKIETPDLHAMIPGLSKHKSLKQLMLGDNGLDDTSGKDLAELALAPSLETLNLKCNFLRVQGVAPLLIALRGNLRLKTLNLRKNQLRNEGAKAVAEFLQDVGCATEDLDLSSNMIEESGGVAVAASLTANKSVRTINLSDNGLGDEFVAALAGTMAENNTLEVIVLENNRITNNGAKSLADGVLATKSVHTLNIENNGLSQFGALTVLRARLDNLRVKIVSSEVKQFITSLG